MKKIIGFFSVLALALVAFVIVTSFSVTAATSDAHTITTNPGENADSEMNVVWLTDLKNTGSYMIYTKKTDTNWKNAKIVKPKTEQCDTFNGVTTIDSAGNAYTQGSFLRCVVNLKDLDSDTEYMYKVGQTIMSDIHYFKTGGAVEYSAAIISDFHGYIKLPNRLTNAMNMIDKIEAYDKSIDFVLEVGDTCAWGGSQNFWQANYSQQNYHDYFWCGCNGNHDNMDKTNTKNTNKFYASTHAYPLNGYEGEEGSSYYFVYSDTLFIAVNTEEIGASNVEQVQAWAQQAIDNNPTKYIVFYEHYQWFNFYSASDYHYNRWKEFFDKNGVDLAISGNHHIYGRTDCVKNDKLDEMGTMYVETSSSDNERGQTEVIYDTSDMSQISTLSSNQKKFLKYLFNEGGKTVSGLVLNVYSDKMTVTLLDRNGNVHDKGTIKAKRSTPTLDETQKASIGNDVKFIQNEIGTQALVLPNTLTGYTVGYELYNGTKLVANSSYKNSGSRYLNLDLDYENEYNYTLKVKFKDGTTETYPVSFTTKQNTGFMNTLTCVGNSLKWNVKDTFSQIANYKISIDGNQIGLVETNQYTILNPQYGKDYVVEALDANGNVLDTLSYRYGVYGDVNKDGVVDDNDVDFLQDYINGVKEITEDVLAYADVNNDGKVNVQDACYIKLYKLGLLPTSSKVTYKVTFIGALGEVAQEIVVEAGQDAKPTFLSNYDYDIISWSGDYHSITQDTILYGTYARKEAE